MAVNINITNKERIFINPANGKRIPTIQKGIVDPNNLGAVETNEGADVEGGKTEEVES